MADELANAAKLVSRAIERARYKPRDLIPILEDDPDFNDGITMWFDPDMNLRSYGPDGTKYQYAKTAVTAASGSLPSDPLPELLEGTYSAVWGRAFCDTHGVEDVPFPGYGDDLATTHGYRKIMIGFDSATIQPDLAGATIDTVELSFTNVEAYADQVSLHVGWHQQTVAPAAWSAVRADTAILEYPRAGQLWSRVDDTFGTGLRDSLFTGLTIEQPAGYVNAGAIDWAATQIRITYTV
jgi:hypothetical protein